MKAKKVLGELGKMLIAGAMGAVGAVVLVMAIAHDQTNAEAQKVWTVEAIELETRLERERAAAETGHDDAYIDVIVEAGQQRFSF